MAFLDPSTEPSSRGSLPGLPDLDPRFNELEVRLARPEDEPAIVRAFNEVFGGHPDFRPRTLESWRWQFRRNPVGVRYPIAVTADGEVAAQYPCVPARFVTPDGLVTASQVVDIMARPEWRKKTHRGASVFVAVGEIASRTSFDEGDVLLYGYPMERALKMGRRYLDFQVVRIVDYLVRQVGVVAPTVPDSVELISDWPAAAEIDRLERATRDGRRLAILRDSSWYRWRYIECPDVDYRCVQARRGGALVGMGVFRTGHASAMTGCTLADWMVPGAGDGSCGDADEEVVDALVGAAEELARSTGGQGIAAIAPPWARDHQWLRNRKFGIVPSAWTLERHLTWRIPPRLKHALTPARLSASWYYTFGDSDLV